MEKVIEQIRLKADSCGDATKEQRARKGAYIDCIVLLKEALQQCNVMLCDCALCDCDKLHDRMEESNNRCITCNRPII